MKKNKRYLSLILLICFLLVFRAEVSAQCSMCKQAAESSMKSNPNSLARSLNSGILYLMAVPYLLILFIFRKQLIKLFKELYARRFSLNKNISKASANPESAR